MARLTLAPFEVQSEPALVVTVQPPASVAAGSPFGLTVQAEDSSGNLNTSFDGFATVALATNPGGAILGGTLSVKATGGVATFSGLTLNEPGIGDTLQVFTSGLPPANTKPFDVIAAPNLYTVDSVSDTGMGTGLSGDLRYVIGRANNDPGSTIDFSVAGTIQLASALPVLTADMTINGPGAASLTVDRSGAAGTPDFSIFTVDADVQAMIAGLTISGGLSGANGGGIDNSGILTVNASTIVNNSANSGGGIENFGGTLTVTDSTIANNTAGNGGGINNDGSTTVTDSTVDNNSGSGIYSDGTLTVTSSTIADSSGSGIYSDGTLTVTNSTIADSSGSGIYSDGTLTVTNSTIADSSGSGIDSDGTLTVTNSTIDSNSAG